MNNQYTVKQNKFLSDSRELAKKRYSQGGDIILECFTDKELLDRFYTLDIGEVDQFIEICYLRREQEQLMAW